MTSSNDGWAVGYDSNNKVVIFQYDGASWKDHTLLPLIAGQLNKVVMTSPTTGWAVGAGGLIMRYSGGQWSVVTSPTTNHIVSLAKVPSSEEEELWASVWKAPLLHYKGGSWQSVSNPVGNNSHFISMAFLSPTDGWAGAANQGFYHYDGVNWQYRTENNGALAFSGINLLSPTNGWSFGGSYFAHFDGQKWQMTQQNVNVSLSSLSMASETDGWAVGGEGTIWRYNSVRSTWSPMPPDRILPLLLIGKIPMETGCLMPGRSWAMMPMGTESSMWTSPPWGPTPSTRTSSWKPTTWSNMSRGAPALRSAKA
jgi:hypothetical protein